jgi:hypothetical protein
MPQASVGNNVTFECSNGGVLTIVGEDYQTDLQRFGVDGTFAYYDDLHIDAYNDMKVEVGGDDNHVTGTVQHVTGDAVMSFRIESREPNGEIDVKLSSLKPGSWYRLRFNGSLAACNGGRAHGRTNQHGVLHFNGVKVPNE